MKILNLLPIALLSASLTTALSIPSEVKALSLRDAATDVITYLEERASIFDGSALEKRKGGGRSNKRQSHNSARGLQPQ